MACPLGKLAFDGRSTTGSATSGQTRPTSALLTGTSRASPSPVVATYAASRRWELTSRNTVSSTRTYVAVPVRRRR